MVKITDDMMERVMAIKMDRAQKIHSNLSEKYNKDSITEQIDYLANAPNLSEIFLAVCVMDMSEYENPEFVLRLAIETNKTLKLIKERGTAMKWLSEL
jgi:hypothetical protein